MDLMTWPEADLLALCEELGAVVEEEMEKGDICKSLLETADEETIRFTWELLKPELKKAEDKRKRVEEQRLAAEQRKRDIEKRKRDIEEQERELKRMELRVEMLRGAVKNEGCVTSTKAESEKAECQEQAQVGSRKLCEKTQHAEHKRNSIIAKVDQSIVEGNWDLTRSQLRVFKRGESISKFIDNFESICEKSKLDNEIWSHMLVSLLPPQPANVVLSLSNEDMDDYGTAKAALFRHFGVWTECVSGRLNLNGKVREPFKYDTASVQTKPAKLKTVAESKGLNTANKKQVRYRHVWDRNATTLKRSSEEVRETVSERDRRNARIEGPMHASGRNEGAAGKGEHLAPEFKGKARETVAEPGHLVDRKQESKHMCDRQSGRAGKGEHPTRRLQRKARQSVADLNKRAVTSAKFVQASKRHGRKKEVEVPISTGPQSEIEGSLKKCAQNSAEQSHRRVDDIDEPGELEGSKEDAQTKEDSTQRHESPNLEAGIRPAVDCVEVVRSCDASEIVRQPGEKCILSMCGKLKDSVVRPDVHAGGSQQTEEMSAPLPEQKGLEGSCLELTAQRVADVKEDGAVPEPREKNRIACQKADSDRATRADRSDSKPPKNVRKLSPKDESGSKPTKRPRAKVAESCCLKTRAVSMIMSRPAGNRAPVSRKRRIKVAVTRSDCRSIRPRDSLKVFGMIARQKKTAS
uniref:Uncharacterized protein n=1 Tax=Amblyomma sculptum TaxID=1581419 RepID=A0A1E1XKE9_AMBSC